MLSALFTIRPKERRDTWAAFFTLFGFIASHSILETARDALFLSKVPASRLPWVYLAIAFASLALARIDSRLALRLKGREALAARTMGASIGTFVFWALLDSLGSAGFYGLYVWSGVLASLVLAHFWSLLGDIFSVRQAKRVYGMIGAGSVLGAIAGSGAASVLARMMSPSSLLCVAGSGFLATAALPFLFRDVAGSAAQEAEIHHKSPAKQAAEPASEGLLEDIRYVRRQPYARRVAWVVIASTACLTVADYVFKSTVAARIPAAELGAYLATVYLVLNVLSLGAQLLLVGWILRRFPLSMALMVLPALLLLGGAGVAFGGGLAAALFIRSVDGALRYSLHRTASELLFVPVGEEARRRMKGFVDVIGQRGAQAAASVGILIAVALAAPSAPTTALAVALTLLAAAWAANAFGLQRHYLDINRRNVREGRVEHLREFPGFDVASMETLFAALDSSNDTEVLAALEVLEREGKGHLVPGLILYHPADEVVERAFALFTRAGRKNIKPIIDRLLDHPSPRVRSAAIAARSVLVPDARFLGLRLSFEDSPEVRATIVINLVASGEIVGEDARDRIEGFLRRGSAATKISLAEAIALRGARGFTDTLIALAKAPEPEARLATTRAMARIRAAEFLPALQDLLGDERTRGAARDALVGYGNDGLQALAGSLADPSLKQALRWELPEAISLFDPQQAASVLLENLPKEPDGMVRYRSIRALKGLVARNPTISFDHETLKRAIEATVSRAYRYLDRRLILTDGAEADPQRATPGLKLLVKLLNDKEENAVGRLFRLLGLAHPTEDFGEIYRGLRTGKKGARASSIELVENLVKPPLRQAVIGLIDDLPDRQRLQASGRYHEPVQLDYEALLEQMLGSTSEALQDITAYHISELGLTRFRVQIEQLPAADRARSDVARALRLLTASEQGQGAAPAAASPSVAPDPPGGSP